MWWARPGGTASPSNVEGSMMVNNLDRRVILLRGGGGDVWTYIGVCQSLSLHELFGAGQQGSCMDMKATNITLY